MSEWPARSSFRSGGAKIFLPLTNRKSFIAMAPCSLCPPEAPKRAIVRRPKTLQPVCKECFFEVFETEIHHTIMGHGQAETTKPIFKRGERVAIGASGGKDSTVLAYIMKLLNERYDYGLDLYLLSIDEGITGYRDASLETVKRNAIQYDLPLKILSYKDLYGGWTMDKVVSEIGKKGNCTYCGVFRRQALDKGADQLTVDHVVTGHNADDVAETVIMNLLRGDVARLERCTAITTGAGEAGGEEDHDAEAEAGATGCSSGMRLPHTVRRSKPFKYTYEKEIVMYAYFKKLEYHSTECIYSPTAYRGYARALVKDLEGIRPSAIVDVIYSGERLAAALRFRGRRAGGDPEPGTEPAGKQRRSTQPVQQTCRQCGSLTSQALCQACALVAGLNQGLSKIDLSLSTTSDQSTGTEILSNRAKRRLEANRLMDMVENAEAIKAQSQGA